MSRFQVHPISPYPALTRDQLQFRFARFHHICYSIWGAAHPFSAPHNEGRPSKNRYNYIPEYVSNRDAVVHNRAHTKYCLFGVNKSNIFCLAVTPKIWRGCAIQPLSVIKKVILYDAQCPLFIYFCILLAKKLGESWKIHFC